MRLLVLAVGGGWATFFLIGGFFLERVGVGIGAGFIFGLSVLFGARAFALTTLGCLLPLLFLLDPWRFALAQEFVFLASYGAALLLYWKLAGSDPPLSSRRSVLSFAASGALAPALSAFIVFGFLEAKLGQTANPSSQFPISVVESWLRQTSGILAFSPVLLGFLAAPLRAWVGQTGNSGLPRPLGPMPNVSRPQVLELALEAFLCGLALWATVQFRVHYGVNITYLAFVPLLLVAWRNGMILGTLALAINTVTAGALWWALGWSLVFPVVDFRLLILVSSLSTLALGLAVDERRLATDRLEQALASLRSAERQLRDIFDGALEGIYRTSADGRSLAANSALASMLGYQSPEEVLSAINDTSNQVWLDPAERIRLTALLAEHGSVRDYVCQFKRKDGAKIWVSIQARAALDGAGQVLYYDGFIEDITERKRTESEQAQLQLQFHQAQKMESVGRLAGGVAHDFNNLLTVINGYSQMLLAKLREGDSTRDIVGEIHKAGNRAAGLTRQLLAFSRKQVLEPRSLDLNRVVLEMRPMLQRLVGEDIEISVKIAAENCVVYADPHQLEQVIMNLAVNSRDAMPRGGTILIETRAADQNENDARLFPGAPAGRYIILAVHDNGVGMDADTQARIFEPFFTTKPVGEGTGLGLSVVQGIVSQSGGHIEVFAEPGRGTTFTVYLPAVALAAEAPKPAEVTVLGGNETVLVVEDHSAVRGFVVTTLEARGYRMIQAENMSQALALCESDRIDLVLTDIVMPHGSGEELATKLRELRPTMKILFMSGYPGKVIEHRPVLTEGAQFIAKPFSPAELAAKVRALLGTPPKARIVVADDDSSVRDFLRKALEDDHYEVIEAANGAQALRQVKMGGVDLVITDLVMPEQEGIETIQALRRELPDVGIIAISGAFGGPYLTIAELLGAGAALYKPVSGPLLLATVSQVLARRDGREFQNKHEPRSVS